MPTLVRMLVCLWALALAPVAAGAQNLDLRQLGAVLALPVVTGGQAPNPLAGSGGDLVIPAQTATTAATVSNASATPVRLKLDVVSGDPPPQTDQCRSTSFECDLAAERSTTFIFDARPGGSEVGFACDDPVTGRRTTRSLALNAQNGILYVGVADSTSGVLLSRDVLSGESVVMDIAAGQTYSLPAIPVQSGDGQNDGDKIYTFDGHEYARFPSVLATNFLAPTASVNAELILFTPDITAGGAAPRVRLGGLAYDDDEEFVDVSYQFDCFDIVGLDAIDANLAFSAAGQGLGSIVGHLVLTPQIAGGPDDVHDAAFGDANGTRRRPAHGWIVQNTTGIFVPAGQPTPGTLAQEVARRASWGRTLAQSRTALIPFGADRPTLDLDPSR